MSPKKAILILFFITAICAGIFWFIFKTGLFKINLPPINNIEEIKKDVVPLVDPKKVEMFNEIKKMESQVPVVPVEVKQKIFNDIKKIEEQNKINLNATTTIEQKQNLFDEMKKMEAVNKK
jgi:hypothetical protein